MRTTGVAPPSDRDNQQGLKSCNCKKSNCLKLYCDCFASSSYCSPTRCNCTACFNNLESEHSRRVAVISTIERNPNAFRSKILSSSNSSTNSKNQSAAEVALHHKGCHCKKSNCLKKYCECFQLGIVCSDRCRCNNCKNFPGSIERNKCLTVGIKEISQIIRKSESSNNVNETPSSSASSSSSTSASTTAPSDESLVRRLDDLGAILTHDVISKVCQSMLLTVFQESKRSDIEVKRKRNIIKESDDLDLALEFPLKKVKSECSGSNSAAEGAKLDEKQDSDDVKSTPTQGQSEGIAVDQSKLIITKLLHAFGMSVLGAVRSLPTHNEVDMSLGISGLHSLKMEKDRAVESLADLTGDSPSRPKPVFLQRPSGAATLIRDGDRDRDRGQLLMQGSGIESPHPFTVRSPNVPSPLPLAIHSSDVPTPAAESTHSSSVDDGGFDTSNNPPNSWQLTQASRSLSVNSSTTTEEQLSQESSEDHFDSSIYTRVTGIAAGTHILKLDKSPFMTKSFPFQKVPHFRSDVPPSLANKVEHFLSSGQVRVLASPVRDIEADMDGIKGGSGCKLGGSGSKSVPVSNILQSISTESTDGNFVSTESLVLVPRSVGDLIDREGGKLREFEGFGLKLSQQIQSPEILVMTAVHD